MKKYNCFLLALFLLVTSTCLSQNNLSARETNCISLFIDFKNHINDCISRNVDVSNSAELEYIADHYLFINFRSDSGSATKKNLADLPENQLASLKMQLKNFFQYFQEHEKEIPLSNIAAIPIRLSADTYIYQRLTEFQKKNVFAFYDKKNPNRSLGYLLFLSKEDGVNSSTKIWSWTLTFKFGKVVFNSVTGEEGYEYLFSSDNH